MTRSPVLHAIVRLINQATSPTLLAQMTEGYAPWF